MQFRKKQEEYYYSIRKEAKEEYFRKERLKLVQKALQQQQHNINNQLQTDEQCSQWILNKAFELKGLPCLNWYNTLRILNKSIPKFRGDFRQWIQTGIIESLVSLFQQQNTHLKISYLASKILYSIYFNDQNFLPKLLQYEQLIPNLINQCLKRKNDVIQISQHLIFLANICLYSQSFRNKVIVNRGVELIKELFSVQVRSPQLLNQYLNYTNAILAVLEDQNHKYYPKSNCVSYLLTQIIVCIPFLNKYIANYQSNQCLKLILTIIKQIVSCNKQFILSNIINSQNIPKLLISFLTHPDIQNRILSLVIITNLMMSYNKSYTTNFVRSKLLDQTLMCYNMAKVQNNKILLNILGLFTNIASNTAQDAQQLINHQSFNIVIEYCHPNQKFSLIQSGIYVIGSIINHRRFNICQFLIKNYKVLDLLMNCLEWSKANCSQTTIQILCAIKNLIIVYQQIYTQGGQNKIFNILNKIYYFDNQLMSLSQHKNKKVAGIADSLIEAMNTKCIHFDGLF